ncbi:MAG: TIM barrel protein [Planctomycetes bacterium]|nr:TIM barrel protein [Planctomycetota bacterium]
MATLATVATFGFPDFDPPIILDLYRRLGCTHCQYYRNEQNQPPIQFIKDACAGADLIIDSIHGVFGDNYDPSSPDEDRRSSSIETYREEAELAIELGGPMIVVHPSPLAPVNVVPPAAELEARRESLLRSLYELAEIGSDMDVVFLLENMPPRSYMGTDPVELAKMLREVDSPHMRMCFDTGHAHVTGTVADRLAACADVIDYLHIHDNDGKEDTHLMPGDGTTDWPALTAVLEKQNINVSAMLEVFYLRDKLEALTRGDLPAKLAKWIAVNSARAI